MDKKIAVFLALLVVLLPVYGYENRDGLVLAFYQGTTRNIRAYDLWAQQKHGAVARLAKVEKLSKAESNLMWGALNEYNYKTGEVYNIVISNSYEMLFLFVEINQGGSVSWYGSRGDPLSSLF